jgi:hypothetical protein
MIENNYGLLRAALAEHFVKAGLLEPTPIAPEQTLKRCALRTGFPVHMPSDESGEQYLKRYAESVGVKAKPLEYHSWSYWRDSNKQNQPLSWTFE